MKKTKSPSGQSHRVVISLYLAHISLTLGPTKLLPYSRVCLGMLRGEHEGPGSTITSSSATHAAQHRNHCSCPQAPPVWSGRVSNVQGHLRGPQLSSSHRPTALEMLAMGKGLCPWLWEHQTLTPQPYSLSLLGKKQYV